jgi:type II secretory pathway component PulF
MSVVEYRYHALTQSGQTRRGLIDAHDEQDVYRKLAEQGLTPIKIAVRKHGSLWISRRRASRGDIAAFTRELSVLVEARIPVAQGIQGIAESERQPELRRMLLDVALCIESGKTIAESIDRHRHTFGDVYIQTLRAAEKGGSLVEITAMLAEMLERQIESSQLLRRALTYPVVVLGVVAVALTVILMFVVPRFSATFSSGNMDLPWITTAIQALAWWLKCNWMYAGGGLVLCIFAFSAAWKTSSGRHAIERTLLKSPIFGRIITAVTAARFSRVFGLSLSSGLDVIESMEVAGAATGRPVFARQCTTMADRLRQGDAMRDVLTANSYLPGFAQRMLSAGKDSSELSRSCDVVARHFERESEHMTKNINQMLEPMLTICLACVVLVVALSVFLPMWQMVKIAQ